MSYLYETEREQDSKERPRKRECERGKVAAKEVASVVKMTVEENGSVGIRIGLRQ